MTQEEKDLLLKDLCARLPYGVIVAYGDINIPLCEIAANGDINYNTVIDDIMPYLFPMSLMTEGLKNEIHPISKIDINDVKPLVLKQYFSYFDWLNENHFDYHGLIERGLAIDATNLNIY